MAVFRSVFQEHHSRILEVLTTSDTTRRSLSSKLYSKKLINEMDMDEIHKEREPSDKLAAMLLKVLRLSDVEPRYQDILDIMETEELLKRIVADMRQKLSAMPEVPMATTEEADHDSPRGSSISQAISYGNDRIESKSGAMIIEMQRQINSVPQLARKAKKLQTDFRKLLLHLAQSLKDTDIGLLKMYISDYLTVSESYSKDLEDTKSVGEIFTFLTTNYFMGYLNYELLKEIIESFASSDEQLQKKFNTYEQDYANFVSLSSFNNLLQVFCQNPELYPVNATGLPEILFLLDKPWPDSPIKTWYDYFTARFNWSSAIALKGVTAQCILVTVVVTRLSLYPDILRDLRDPNTIAELQSDGIRIIDITYAVDKTYRELYGAVVNGDLVHAIRLIKTRGMNVNMKFRPAMNVLGNSESLLHLAVDTGQHSVLCALIKLRADVNITDKSGKTPLYSAIQLGHDDMVQTLLDHGAKIDEAGRSYLHYFVENHQLIAIRDLLSSESVDRNLPDKFGNTPLHSAIRSGKLDVIEVLLQHGVDWTIKNKQGWSPLYLAAMENEVAVQTLLTHGVSMDCVDNKDQRSYLHYAACNGHTNAVEVFLKHEFNVNTSDKDSKTSLHLAAENGYKQITYKLLMYGAMVNGQDVFGRAPLHYAALNGYADVVSVLNDYGANIDITDEAWSTPLMLAATSHLHVVQQLLSFNADITIKSKDGWTPLNQAAWNGQNEILKELLQYDCSAINDVDEEGWTAIHHAIRQGHGDIVRTLLSHGANINVEDEGKWTLLHVAAQRGHAEVVEVLLEKGFNVNVQDENGWSVFNTALVKAHTEVVRTMIKFNVNVTGREKEDGKTSIHHAVDSLYSPRRPAVVELLLAHRDVDPNARDDFGMTPLHYAVSRGYVDIARLLLERGADISQRDENGESPLDQAQEDNEMMELFQEFI